MDLEITSTAFQEGELIPRLSAITCIGGIISILIR